MYVVCLELLAESLELDFYSLSVCLSGYDTWCGGHVSIDPMNQMEIFRRNFIRSGIRC